MEISAKGIIMTIDKTDPKVQQAVELAEIKMGMQNIEAALSDIKQDLSAIRQIDKTIAEMTAHNMSTQREITTIWKKYDDVIEWKETVESRLNKYDGARQIVIIFIGAFKYLQKSY